MDINLCIDHLGLNANQYRLNQSNAPHKIIEWRGSDPQPTQAELETAWSEIEQSGYFKKTADYSIARAEAYPSWQEQMDMMFHDQTEGSRTWLDAIEAVKEAYPK